MAHSVVSNAGQAYASARKRGVETDELVRLKAVIVRHKHSKETGPTNTDLVAITQRIARENMLFRDQRSCW